MHYLHLNNTYLRGVCVLSVIPNFSVTTRWPTIEEFRRNSAEDYVIHDDYSYVSMTLVNPDFLKRFFSP